MKNRITAWGIIACLGITLLTGQAWGKIPQNMNLQGKVVDSTGKSLADGVYDFEVALYKRGQRDVLYRNVIRNVTVTNGIFSAVLDTLDPAMFNDEIEVQVRVDTETFAAKQITAVPYAINASRLEGKTLDQIKAEIGSSESGPFTFSNNGRVGLGTNDPDVTLDLVGDMRIKGKLYPWSTIFNNPNAKLEIVGTIQTWGDIIEGDKRLAEKYALRNESISTTTKLKIVTAQSLNVERNRETVMLTIGPNKTIYDINVVYRPIWANVRPQPQDWFPLGVEHFYYGKEHPEQPVAITRYDSNTGQVFVTVRSDSYNPKNADVNIMVTYSD